MAGLDELYDEGAVSVEAMDMNGPGTATSRGLAAIKAKHEWWNGAFEVTGGKVEGPYLHGADRFAVIFAMETRNRETGETGAMQEVAVYTVNEAGRIVREEFFY
ncbi:SnoaL-like domain-containing protein [Amaricoccus sp.]|uniref:SnoaL-like domain-containing protein n=1 Tax=Amaricoccus sp. TaxID=1872485 RepID=UPI0025C536C6|nr:SnoaL-like domain-containing protein [Amaricoccus sp.]